MSSSILVYCGDSLGLGHLRRNTAIAERLVREQPGSNCLLLTGVPTGSFFKCPPGVDVIKLPSLTKFEGDYSGRTLNLDRGRLRELRVELIESVARCFKPDLFLVDHLPTGIWGELPPTLKLLRANGCRPVLGLRDFLDDPSRTKTSWRERGIYSVIDEHYEEVLIYGSRKVFDTNTRYELDQHTATPVRFCGYVGQDPAQDESTTPELQRNTPGSGARKLVLVTGGGGADAYPMMKRCIEAIRCYDRADELDVVCITGPLMQPGDRDALRSMAAGLSVNILWCVERAARYFAAADLVITMAGYNTVLEAIRQKRRVLLIPRSGPSAEQLLRARNLSRLGLATCVEPQEQTPRRLATSIQRSLATAPPEQELPDLDGLDNVVHALQEILERPRVPTIAPGVGVNAG